jgi:hypothetical protein
LVGFMTNGPKGRHEIATTVRSWTIIINSK